jgi:hypothetical protein
LAGALGKEGNTALIEELAAAMLRRFSAMLSLSAVDKRLPPAEDKLVTKAAAFLNEGFSDDRWLALYIWSFLSDLAGDGKKMPRSEVLFDQWRFASVINECLRQMGKGDWNAEHLISTVKMLMVIQGWHGGMSLVICRSYCRFGWMIR